MERSINKAPPLKVDIKLKFKPDKNLRQCSKTDIIEIIGLYNAAIKYYSDLSDELFNVYIFKKNNPVKTLDIMGLENIQKMAFI